MSKDALEADTDTIRDNADRARIAFGRGDAQAGFGTAVNVGVLALTIMARIARATERIADAMEIEAEILRGDNSSTMKDTKRDFIGKGG